MLSNCGAGEESWESLELQGEKRLSLLKEINPEFHWKNWCWSWSSNCLATRCKEPTHWRRPWGWERLRAGGEGSDRGWHSWVASLSPWTWIWANSGIHWRIEKSGVRHSMGSQRVGHNLATEQQEIHLFTKLKQTHGHWEQTYGYQRGKGGGIN